MTDAILFNSRSQKYSDLSNFSPHSFRINDMEYRTAEHFYQASKCRDHADHLKIKNAPSPQAAKGMGRRVKLVGNWEHIKFKVMIDAINAKFGDQRHSELRSLLISTFPHKLIHLSPWDLLWGADHSGKGKNALGLIMTIKRAELVIASRE